MSQCRSVLSENLAQQFQNTTLLLKSTQIISATNLERYHQNRHYARNLLKILYFVRRKKNDCVNRVHPSTLTFITLFCGKGRKKLSNGYSRANLASASTCQKISIFGEYSHSPKWPFSEICETRRHSQTTLPGLARLANIRQRPFLKKM